MEFNRIVSLVLGFVVLILVFVWISNRFRSNTNETKTQTPVTITTTPSPTTGESTGWNPLGFLFHRDENSPTPTRTNTTETSMIAKLPQTTTPVQIRIIEGAADGSTTQTAADTQLTYTNTSTKKTSAIATSVEQIPETGAPTLFLPLALSLFAGGMYLKKTS